MPVEDARVRMVEDRRLDGSRQQGLGLAHEVLVERVLARDEHGETGRAAAGPAPLLPQRRDGAGEADRHRAVERADVDPQLERVRRRDAEQLPGHQPLLDLAALRRRVAGAVRSQPGSERGLEAGGGEAVDQLDGLAALREADRPLARRDEAGEQARRIAEGAGADAQLGVDQLRVPERDRPLGRRRSVAVDHGGRLAEQRLCELRRVRDRRRCEHELRLRVVRTGEPAQAAEDVGDVRAEDTAIDVRLVDDDVAEVREHVAPAVVVRQDADVEHVRVGQDHVRPLADLPAALALGVAVVDRRLDALDAEGRERPRLVLRERLRRVEVERPALRLAREQVEHRQVEGEALAARGARRHDRVAAFAQRLPGLRLVPVERGDPLADERRGDARVEVVRERLRRPGSRRLDRHVRQLLPLQQLEPGRADDAHAPYASLRSDLPGCPAGAEITPVEPDPARTGEGS